MTAVATKTLRAIIYARISEDRFDEREGTTEQVESCEAYATERGLDVVAVLVDNNRSATRPDGKRPNYDRAMQMIQRGEADVIVVKYTSRLYRRLADLVTLTEVLKRADVPVWSVKSGEVDLSTADGRLRANIMGSVSQHETDVMGERVSAASLRRAKKGLFNGGQRRMGYRHRDVRIVYVHKGDTMTEIERPTGPLVLVRAEAAAVRWAYLHVQRGGSLESVVRMWRRHGLVGPTGKQFVASTVRDVLLRPMNGGVVMYKGEILAATSDAPAIVEAKTWHSVVAILSNPARRSGPGQPDVTVLAPVLVCTVCRDHPERMKRGNSSKMTARSRKRDDSKDLIYGCRDGHATRQRAPLDLAVQALILEWLKLHGHRFRAPASNYAGQAELLAKAEELRGRLGEYQAMAAEMNPTDFRNATATIRATLAEVDERIIASSGNPGVSALLAAVSMEETWAGMDVRDRHVVLREVIDHIAISPGRSGVRGATMEGVRIVAKDASVIYEG